MRLARIQVAGVRNLADAEIRPAAGLNIFTGVNGSGKTSLLEAVALLGTARSFRTASIETVINDAADGLSVFAEVVDSEGAVQRVGVGRMRRGRLQVRLQGQNVQSAAALAEVLPVQVIAPDLGQVVAGEPGLRRRFLDWGVFHAEPTYATAWRDLRRALQQRNAALRASSRGASSARAFDAPLAAAANRVEALRSEYVRRFQPVFEELAAEFALQPAPELSYRPGWDTGESLEAVMARSYDGDVRAGHTRYGPHRADFRVMLGRRRAGDVLSRGQLKCVAFTMLAAQGRLLGRQSGRQAVYLVDDLMSELDAAHRTRALAVLAGLGAQVFVADVAESALREALSQVAVPGDSGSVTAAWFHVEHGRCRRAD